MFREWEAHFGYLEFIGHPGRRFEVDGEEVVEIIVSDVVVAEPLSSTIWKYGDHRHSSEKVQSEIVTKLLADGHHWGNIKKIVSIDEMRYNELQKVSPQKSIDIDNNPE